MTPRSRSLSLSLALHGALLTGLAWIGFGRTPDEAPAGVTVVWLETGLLDLAAASRGNGGIADTAEPDAAAELLPDPIAAVEPADEPAAPSPNAQDPVSGADRPAPVPTELADENRERRSETDAPAGDVFADLAADSTDAVPPPPDPADVAAGASAEARPEETGVSAEAPTPITNASAEASADASTQAEDASGDAPAQTEDASADTRTRIASASAETTPLIESDPADVPPRIDNASAKAPPQPRGASAEARPTAATAADASAAPADAAAPLASRIQPRAALEPVSPDVREMLRDEVMDLLNRSRELPSKASAAWSRDGHEYRAEMTRVLSAGATGIEEALIEVTTERDGRHVSTEMRVKRLAFSHYAQLIDRWDPNVQIHDDVIDGRFHSNTEIVIANSGGVHPVFHGTVTTTSGIDTTRSTRRVRRSEVFLGGLETRVPRIALPRRFAPLEAIAADAVDIVALETDSRITFFADGRYAIEPIGGGRRGQARPDHAQRAGRLGSSPTYFIAAEKTAVAVEGILNGKVLVYSPDEIVIEGDLVYAADPTRIEDSDDYLGLVSDGTVAIAEPGVTGPGDLDVHAAIYAKRQFAVRRYSSGERATLFIYGSVTAGSLTATEPRYRTELVFDPRLEDARPPSFPMTDRYELASWDGAWRVAER